ncbi:hypothetical protein [Saccharothrix obliqua]|uniref:hypothetical protein n=1 Tax=Saccharothrix obliqua TaxID=2861747 RepID=UPI001C5D6BB9|nr:hypothetical protein [Saccharothrix obliqua]MBW4722291.1 hypothetical protein [Saccharothrix obliqua]
MVRDLLTIGRQMRRESNIGLWPGDGTGELIRRYAGLPNGSAEWKAIENALDPRNDFPHNGLRDRGGDPVDMPAPRSAAQATWGWVEGLNGGPLTDTQWARLVDAAPFSGVRDAVLEILFQVAPPAIDDHDQDD